MGLRLHHFHFLYAQHRYDACIILHGYLEVIWSDFIQN